MTAYSEKLKDPRWQKKRLEILLRDNWTCQRCQDTVSPLHVHHRHYMNGLEPWEYAGAVLVTLCYQCHEAESLEMPMWDRLVVGLLKEKGFLAPAMGMVADAVEKLEVRSSPKETAEFLLWLFSDKATMDAAWGDFIVRDIG